MALPVTDAFPGGGFSASLNAYNANWTNLLNAIAKQTSNDVYPNSGSNESCAYRNDETFNNDQYSQLVLVAVSAGAYIGPAVRSAGGAGYYTWYASGSDRYLAKVTSGGTFTAIYSDATDGAVSDLYRLEVSGTSLTAKVNGGTVTTQTDATYASGSGGIGGYGQASSMRGDDFEAGNLGSSATLEQEGYRWRNDDGSESAATWLASQDANIEVAVEVPKRLRVLVNASGDPASKRFKLQYRPTGGDTWLDIK